MQKQQKMTALKPFVFRGRMLAVDEELEPDNEAQAKLLSTIGLAAHSKRRGAYRNRSMQSEHRAVMANSSPEG